jgi:putative N6-adenine-specific DNA methylase
VNFSLFLPCAGGVEEWLAEEAMAILGPDTHGTIERGGIALSGGARAVMALNLESRLAQRVLVQVARGPYRLEDDLYARSRPSRWT